MRHEKDEPGKPHAVAEMPRRKYGHMVTNIGKKADDRRPMAGCPKCARGACGIHL